jgi:hypothetical protein
VSSLKVLSGNGSDVGDAYDARVTALNSHQVTNLIYFFIFVTSHHDALIFIFHLFVSGKYSSLLLWTSVKVE